MFKSPVPTMVLILCLLKQKKTTILSVYISYIKYLSFNYIVAILFLGIMNFPKPRYWVKPLKLSLREESDHETKEKIGGEDQKQKHHQLKKAILKNIGRILDKVHTIPITQRKTDTSIASSARRNAKKCYDWYSNIKPLKLAMENDRMWKKKCGKYFTILKHLH